MKTTHLQQIIGEQQISIAIEKIVDDILMSKPTYSKLVLLGVLSKGYDLAKRIKNVFYEKTDVELDVYALDVTLYRDDLMKKGSMLHVVDVEPLPNLDAAHVILVDDIFYEGRTIRAALAALVDYGHVEKVECAVLVDRGHRKMPVQAHFVGFYIETRAQDYLRLRLLETDGSDEILLETHA